MSQPAQVALSDEEFLDRVFVRVVGLLENGEQVEVEALLEGRAHLRSELDSLLHTARKVALVHVPSLPVVRGFTLLSEIGRGGMGTVYLARQESLDGRRVAVKVLPASAVLSPKSRQRFLAEARALANLRHAHVVTVHDVLAEGDVLAYAMEWIDGDSLSSLLGALKARQVAGSLIEPSMADVRARLEVADESASYPRFVCRIAVAIARALGALHRAGLVHRDVKPSNILLRRDGTPLLSDFGLVHATAGELTQSGHFVGTIAYASPEQLDGDAESLDARSDVFSLGITLYQALTLHLPFDDGRSRSTRATTPSGMLRLIESGKAAPLRTWNPRLTRDLETIVAMAIDPDPARRYASADELADDLERLLELQPIRARRSNWLARTAKLVRRNRAGAWGMVGGSSVTLVLAAALFVYAFFVPRWVEGHVREARLALLDPTFANAIFSSKMWAGSDRVAPPFVIPTGLSRALKSYDAALRWSRFDAQLREEREVVSRAAGGVRTREADWDERSIGLFAFLNCDVEGALSSWTKWQSARDPLEALDPLLEAALGTLHLVSDEPARAYPRLREACQAFPNVGFLTTYLADAAVQCGDFGHAERLLVLAARMPNSDPMGAAERVWADLYAATGRDVEAEALFRRVRVGPGVLHYARFFESRGRIEESIDQFVRAGSELTAVKVQVECADALDRWWSREPRSRRWGHIRTALDLTPTDPSSLAARARFYVTARARARAAAEVPETRTPFFASAAARFSSPALQSVGLTDVARILEVENMNHWHEITRYSPPLKTLQLCAWHSPWPQAMSRGLRAVALASGASLALVASTEAQTCASAPCFEGLGDLAGGPFNSLAIALSSDGSTVVGSSESANSGNWPELFRWRSDTGMVGLGDLAGATFGGYAYGVSADGGVVTGWSSSGLSCASSPSPEAFRWTPQQGISGTGFGAYCDSAATGISDDGLTMSGSIGGSLMARWSGDAWQHLTTNPSHGWGISHDGTWIAGSYFGGSGQEASRHSLATGIELLGDLTGGAYFSQAYAISNASVAVGISSSTNGSSEAFRWSPGGPMVGLGDLPGGGFESAAWRISADGSLIVGYGKTAAGNEAVLWDASLSIQRLADLLLCAGVAIPSGWVLTGAADVAINGNVITICGRGTNPNGDPEGWITRFEMPSSAVVSYCTAGTTTNNCNASMSATGVPSIAATSGFTLYCTNVEGQKSGLVFYGISGPKAVVWAPGSSSYLCVKSPTQRSSPSNSGGTANACDGSFSLDFLAYLATHPSALGQPFTAGQRVHAQAWFRDPPAPGTTNLSNGLQFTTSP